MLIDVQQLRRVYTMGQSEVVALDRIDLQIDAGEFVNIAETLQLLIFG